jgi:dimethylglycine dehydrogenase
VAKLQAYTISLYKELEELTGLSCGLHLVGGVMMADSPERMDFLRMAHARGRCLGMETELITPAEAKAMFPLMDESHFVGALWDPVEGHLDPSGTTHAYAKAARMLGAEIELRNPVTELTQDPDGTWNVITRTARSAPSMWSTPAASGRARWGGWSASNCRCWRWSTCTC